MFETAFDTLQPFLNKGNLSFVLTGHHNPRSVLGGSSGSSLTSDTQSLTTGTRSLLVTFDLSETAVLTLQASSVTPTHRCRVYYRRLTAFCKNERGVSGPDIDGDWMDLDFTRHEIIRQRCIEVVVGNEMVERWQSRLAQFVDNKVGLNLACLHGVALTNFPTFVLLFPVTIHICLVIGPLVLVLRRELNQHE
jgi:hypothetical protein